MRVLLAMVRKDLLRRLRQPLPTLLLLLFPLIFSGLIALSFGTDGTKTPKVRLLLDDQDGGLVAQLVLAAFNRGEAQQYFETQVLAPTDADAGASDAARLETGQATALLRLPKGFSADVLAGRPTQLILVKSPAQSILPDVAEQVTTVLAEGLSAASRVLRGPLDQVSAGPARADGMPADSQVADIAVLVNRAIGGARRYVLPPVIQLATAPAATEKPAARASNRPAIFLLVLPGIAVFALFNLADQTMRDLLVEARLKTLRRQLAGPLSAGLVIAGKALATAVVAGLAVVALSLVGAFTLSAPVSLAGYLLLSLALVLAATGFASVVFGLAKGEKQGATLASLLSLVMAFAGGSFIPLDSLPKALAAVSPYSLIYWATAGYRKLLSEGAGLRAVTPNIAILAGIGAVLLLVSGRLWRRRLLQGDLS